MICTACKTAADTGQPHDRCDNAGKKYDGCPCQHRPGRDTDGTPPVNRS